MMTKIKEFRIVFKNSDEIAFPCEVVDTFLADGITESVSILSSSNGMSLHNENHAKRILLKINLNKALDLNLNIGLDASGKHIPIHERIKNLDITHFCVSLEDGFELRICPPWEHDGLRFNRVNNPYQKHKSIENEGPNGLQQMIWVYYGFDF